MSGGTHLSTWVSSDTKQRFAAVAHHQGLSESALLKRLVELMFHTANAAGAGTTPAPGKEARDSRLTIRLRADDQLLLRERAAARGMPAATYVSVLVRAHLRALTPLPKDELGALRRSVAELSAIGRNLNQLARAANQGNRSAGSSRDDLRTILKACEGLRDHIRALIQANLESWRNGHDEAPARRP